MAAKTEVVSQQFSKPVKVVKWKVSEGYFVSIGTVLLVYDFGTGTKGEHRKLKSSRAGSVCKLVAQEGAIVNPGEPLLELQACIHPTVVKDMCAECGADLRKDDLDSTASVPMIHSVPDLKVSKELAQKIGRADEERLLRDRKLVLLVDLDQTLIHTTNDIIPPNIKDVYHFQLYGPHSPWYHTRLRPGTHQFLMNISPYFELHICTFGARNYAHRITQLLDPDGRFFSNRVLSRDECFNPTSKTANLSALFPCGDHMVCIIDDREDVWSYATNLIHVKPYHFFQHTGDINAPPGLDKHEDDDKLGVDLSKIVSKEDKGSEESEKEGTKEDHAMDDENEDNVVNIVEKNVQDVEGEKKDLISVKESEKVESKEEENVKCDSNFKEEEVKSISDNSVGSENQTEGEKKIVINGAKAELKRTKDEKKELKSDLQEQEEVKSTKKKETSNKNESAKENEIKNSEAVVHQDKLEDMDTKELTSEIPNLPVANSENNIIIEDHTKSLLNSSLNLIEIDDPDDYLLYLEDILKKVHKAFYEQYDKMESGAVPDLKKIIPEVKGQVLKGIKMVFSGLVPTHIKLKQSKAYQIAKSLGAEVTQDLEEDTTHLVAVRRGTAKVNAGRRRKNLKIVTPDWLWACAERWERVNEKLFPLSSKGSKNRHPPPHCSSPEHVPDYMVHNTPAARKRTDSGRFMDTINPLMSFSTDDIADMDKEVEDTLEDGDSESERDATKNPEVEETEEPEGDDVDSDMNKLIKEMGKNNDEENNSTSSSSVESITAEMPRGHKRRKQSKYKEELDEEEEKDSDSDEPSAKFRRGENIDSDLDIGGDSNSEGSVEPPDEMDDGEWNMMGAALEREFLSNN